MNISRQKLEVCVVNKHMTLPELAKRSGLSKQSLAAIRRRETCRISTAIKLCIALECNIEDIIPTESEARA